MSDELTDKSKKNESDVWFETQDYEGLKMELLTDIQKQLDSASLSQEEKLALFQVIQKLTELHAAELDTKNAQLATLEEKYQEAFDKSERSPRTGLFMWRSETAEKLSNAILDIAGRKNIPVSFCLIDVDFLKVINEKYGYSSGTEVLTTLATSAKETVTQELLKNMGSSTDEVIKEVSASLTERLRESDAVFEFGVDEFVILLPGVTIAEIPEILERVIENFEQRIAENFKISDEMADVISFSCGATQARVIHEFRDDSVGYEDRHKLFDRADAFLVASKNQRNTLFIDNGEGNNPTVVRLRESVRDLTDIIVELPDLANRYGIRHAGPKSELNEISPSKKIE